MKKLTRRVVYFRSQRKSQTSMLNINENCRNLARKRPELESRLFGKQCKQGVHNLLWKDKDSRLKPQQLVSIILPFILLLNFTTSQITTSVSAQKVSLTPHQASLNSNEDEELSKTMNGIGEDELNLNHLSTTTTITTNLSSTLQPKVSSSSSYAHNTEIQSQQGQQINGHSIKSIWTPTDGNHDESLGSSAELMRQPKGEDEEFAGHAESSYMNRQFISVLNNQSDIVFNNNTKHDSEGNELQHATTFLLGKTAPLLITSGQTFGNGHHHYHHHHHQQQQKYDKNNNDNNNHNKNKSNDNEQNNYDGMRDSSSSNGSILLGARFNEGLFTSPSSVRMVQFESQSNVTDNKSNLVASSPTSSPQPSQVEPITSSISIGTGSSSSSGW